MNDKNPETKLWYERAEKDLKAAKDSLASDNFEWASFQAHQAVEKALKAIYIKKFSELIKTHDLVLLANRIDADQITKENCNKLNSVYLDARYPDVPAEYTKERAQLFIQIAGEVLQWIKKTL